MLGWLYVGVVISARLVRFHYACITIGAFFQCVLGGLYACIAIGPNV
jgi:hypothetical protein